MCVLSVTLMHGDSHSLIFRKNCLWKQNLRLWMAEYHSLFQPKTHSTWRAADRIWRDIIGLQSPFHRNFNTWHTSPLFGQACRWRQSRGSLRRITVCGIWKGHLQEALDMTSSASICMLWLLCGLNITDGFQTTGATAHFSAEAAKSYPHRLK